MDREKPYCKEGESESYKAVGWCLFAALIFVPIWFFLLWWIGIIAP